KFITGLGPALLTQGTDYVECFSSSTNATLAYASPNVANLNILGGAGAPSIYNFTAANAAQFNAACTANVTPYACCTGVGTGTCTGMPSTLGAQTGGTFIPAFAAVN